MAYYLYSSGDLSQDTFQNSDSQAGSEAHRYLQGKYKKTDIKEYYVREKIEALDCNVTIKGYIDGVLNNGSLIEEIKSSHYNVLEFEEITHREHLAQLKLYCYLYMQEKMIDCIDARLTYISIDNYETKSFNFHFDFDDAEKFFYDSLFLYLEWLIKLDDQGIKMRQTIQELTFPFPTYRKGQREFMKYVYCTIRDNDILYAIAPTGIGKTMATIYSALKSIKKDNKIFYLTSKSLLKEVALNAMEILKEKGLMAKTIELSNKDKSCLLEERNCDNKVCPYMKYYYNHLHEAIREIYDNQDIWNYENITQMAIKYKICPFEFSLDLSYYADIIVADYNYAFCPRTHLIRYFDDDTYKPILLVDEAHNLVSRSKDMYSAEIRKESLISLRKILSSIKPSSRKNIKDIINYLDKFGERNNYPEFYCDDDLPQDFLELTHRLTSKLETVFKENIEFKGRNEAMSLYFDFNRFNKIAGFYNENFRFILEYKDDCVVRISCLDASEFILQTIKQRAFGTVFFSATMYPLDYYKMLITKNVGESIIIPSPFDQNQLKMIVKNDVSTKYQSREASVFSIIEVIEALVSYKKGNYIVFFPSYEYLNLVYNNIKEHNYDIIIQSKDMTSEERKNTLNLFNSNEKTQVGFFVMGGSFSEGIDYIGDMLSGVLVISVGLPMINEVNNLLVEHFDKTLNDGFNYAYTYPGFTKVVQAVGRVIRTESDRGVAILFDSRFNLPKYRNLMPKEWSNRVIINDLDKIKQEIKKFKK